ncbi:MAG TPA: hypothetical protein VH640_09730 [Bryobacteraceae bacterium]|jgi:hypothetical protein
MSDQADHRRSEKSLSPGESTPKSAKPKNDITHLSTPDFVSREGMLEGLLTAYILAGLLFLLLPGTTLGFWNLFSISATHSSESISPAWLQAHGHGGCRYSSA